MEQGRQNCGLGRGMSRGCGSSVRDANQVHFHSGKEGLQIIVAKESQGADSNIFGVEVDVKLTMQSAIDEVVPQESWKLKMLVRTRRYYTDSELVLLYKPHLLSYIEYRTPAIYHATRDMLCRLDRIQDRFLVHAGIDEKDALIHFHLAPLSTR